MTFSQQGQGRLGKYSLLAVISITLSAFAALPDKPVVKPSVSRPTDLSVYFKAPQLPDEFCNTCDKKPVKKSAKHQKIILPSLRIPVLGATRKSIISIYGDARDNGRTHEGIDIVAPKGTIIVAPIEGEITAVSYNSLGGKVIWLKDLNGKRAYYFAHLDSQIVKKGMIVKAGDTLGTVGNTGNARRTPSHLHFGIYKQNGRKSVDYIKTKEQVFTMLAAAE